MREETNGTTVKSSAIWKEAEKGTSMTKKAMRLLLANQAKASVWFICIYVFIMSILVLILTNLNERDMEWVAISTAYAPKIYLLVIGIISPLTYMELYMSRGLTRTQFFWAFTEAIAILSVFLFLPTIIAEIIFGNISLLFIITHYIQMPLSFIMGWTVVIGFQYGKWFIATLGINSAVALFIGSDVVIEKYNIIGFPLLGLLVIITAALLLILPRIIARVPIKSSYV